MISYLQECKDLFALAAWMQTFPEFTTSLYTGTEANEDVERILSMLNTSEATAYVKFYSYNSITITTNIQVHR
jgi:hypothetical protein